MALLSLYSSPTTMTTNSLQKSPAFGSILKTTNHYGFRRNHNFRIQPLKLCSSSSSAVVNFSGSSIKQKPSLGGGFYSLQRNSLGFSIGAAANGNGGGGGGDGGEETKKKKLFDEDLAGVQVAAKVIMVVAVSVSMNVVFVTVSQPIITYLGRALAVFARFIGALVSAVYSDLVASAPVPGLTVITMLTSVVVAIAEATVEGSPYSQAYHLTVAGIAGYAAVKSMIPQPLFWVFLVGVFLYSMFVERKDGVSSAFPAAAVLTVVGGPWVRLLVISSYTWLAISQMTLDIDVSNKIIQDMKEGRIDISKSVLLPTALAIGFRVATKCFQCWHLKWMTV